MSIEEGLIVCSVADGVSGLLQSSINTEYIITLWRARGREVSEEDVIETITSWVKPSGYAAWMPAIAGMTALVLHPGTPARMAKKHARFPQARLLLNA